MSELSLATRTSAPANGAEAELPVFRFKVCTKCGQSKGHDHFWKCSNSEDKLQSWCKECSRARKEARPRPARTEAAKARDESRSRAADLVAAGYGDAFVSERVGLHPSTISRWRRLDKGFKRMVTIRGRELPGRTETEKQNGAHRETAPVKPALVQARPVGFFGGPRSSESPPAPRITSIEVVEDSLFVDIQRGSAEALFPPLYHLVGCRRAGDRDWYQQKALCSPIIDKSRLCFSGLARGAYYEVAVVAIYRDGEGPVYRFPRAVLIPFESPVRGAPSKVYTTKDAPGYKQAQRYSEQQPAAQGLTLFSATPVSVSTPEPTVKPRRWSFWRWITGRSS